MWNFKSIVFISTQTYREIFKSTLVYFVLFFFGAGRWTNGKKMKQNKSCLRHTILPTRWYTTWEQSLFHCHANEEKGWINCQKYIIDLTFCSTYRHFSSTCKWYLWSVNKNFVEKEVLKILNWIYILLGIITSAILLPRWLLLKQFAPAKLSAIANCQGEFWGLDIWPYFLFSH